MAEGTSHASQLPAPFMERCITKPRLQNAADENSTDVPVRCPLDELGNATSGSVWAEQGHTSCSYFAQEPELLAASTGASSIPKRVR